MPYATETTRTQRWLRSRLSTVGLPVFRGQAPEGETLPDGTIIFPRRLDTDPAVPMYPCIIFRRQGGVDVTNLQGTYMVRSVWLAFVAARSDEKPESQQGVNAVETHADALHDALTDQPLTTVAGRVIADCLRESEFDSPVVESGVEYQRIGGVYRVLSSRA